MVGFDVVDDVANRQELFRLFVRDFDTKLFFDCHDQLDRIKRVAVEVFDEPCFQRHLFRVYPELFGNNITNPGRNVSVRLSSMFFRYGGA